MRQQWKYIEFLFILVDSRLRQLKKCDHVFGGLNILVFGDLMQLPPVRGHQVFYQPQHMIPSTHLWRLFTLIELNENMRQQGDMTFVNILNALRVGELKPEHFAVLLQKVGGKATGEFAIEKALRIYPTNQQVRDHNQLVLQHFQKHNHKIYKIKDQDRLIDAPHKTEDVSMDNVIPNDVNKTGGLPKELDIFVGAKVMLRSNINVSKGLVNGNIGFITEITWPHFRRTQMYETDLPTVHVNFGRDGIHKIEPISIQFPAKYSYGTAERRMLPLILSWASTVHKMQGSTVDYAVVNLGPALFADGQAYVALSRVRSLDGLQIEEIDNVKLTGKKPCNTEAVIEMERMRNYHPNQAN